MLASMAKPVLQLLVPFGPESRMRHGLILYYSSIRKKSDKRLEGKRKSMQGFKRKREHVTNPSRLSLEEDTKRGSGRQDRKFYWREARPPSSLNKENIHGMSVPRNSSLK